MTIIYGIILYVIIGLLILPFRNKLAKLCYESLNNEQKLQMSGPPPDFDKMKFKTNTKDILGWPYMVYITISILIMQNK